VILAYAQILGKRDDMAPKARQSLERIQTQVQRLDGLLNELLLMAKLEEGRLTLNRSRTDVREIVRAVGESYRPVADSRGLVLEVGLPEDARFSELDGDLVTRVVDNMLSNAFKFSPAGGTVRLLLTHPEEGEPGCAHRICVEDQGPGIPEELRSHVFDKFATVAARASGPLQVGLGLAFCRMVVEAHGGRISVQPNLPAGSIFTVEL
jgi:signal transduction histidine kinase